MMRTITIIVPVYNEEPNIDLIYGRICAVFEGALARYQLELIFSDNASSDGSFERIRLLAAKDARVRGIRLSRNFGFQANILSGLVNAAGDAVVQLDADGEDPPEVLPSLVAKWEEGFDVVYGIRTNRQESALLTFQRKLFYRLLKAVADIHVPVDAGDFRLIDRRVVRVLRERFKEHNPYLRGLISFAGFRQAGVPYARDARTMGVSKFSFWSYMSLAFDALTSFSRLPLRLVSFIGVLISMLSFVALICYMILYFAGMIPVRGFATLILVMLLAGGLQLLSLGVVGEYICRIFDEVKARPRTIVADSCGFKEEPRET
jgi:glycosyltransferase involved in cell wall biosynthesis